MPQSRRSSFAWLTKAALVAASPIAAAASQTRQLPPFPRALPAAHVADSLKTFNALDAYVARNAKDVQAQHRLGTIAFGLELAAREPGAPRNLNRTRLRRTAERAYQAALDLEPDVPLHWLALGRFYTTGIGNSERLPRIYYDRGIVIARELRDTAMVATMALELGTLHWRHAEAKWRSGAQITEDLVTPSFADLVAPDSVRAIAAFNLRYSEVAIDDPLPGSLGLRYRSAAHRTVYGAAGSDTLHGLASLLSSAGRHVRENFHPFGGITAESFYLNAEAFVSEAYALRPTDSAVFHRLAGVFLLEERWSELSGLATARNAARPDDGWALLALGLAQQRLGDRRRARASLDSGFRLLAAPERTRLDRIDRVLSPRDSAAFARSDSATRAHTTSVFWQLADPLWSDTEGDPRTEFLARIAYAEFRYTFHDDAVRGADTPEGALYVRYGPPDDVRGPFWLYRSGLVLGGCMRQSPIGLMGEGPRRRAANIECGEDSRLLAEIVDWQPARWDNAVKESIDSIPAQIVRFRAAADSVDVYLGGRVGLERLRGAQVLNGTVRADLWLFAWDSPESRRRMVEPVESARIEFRERMPRGRYYYRIEASAPGTLLAARAAGTVDGVADSAAGFVGRGFGMSDILLADSTHSAKAVTRWSDLTVVPHFGPVERGRSLSLVWETYELARRGSDAEYTVSVAIRRARPSAQPIAVRLVANLVGAVGRRSDTRSLTMQFDRRVRHADAVVENVELQFGDTPPDTYRVTVTVTDRATGTRVERWFPVTIVERER